MKPVCGSLLRQAEFILQVSKPQTVNRKSRDKVSVSSPKVCLYALNVLKENKKS